MNKKFTNILNVRISITNYSLTLKKIQNWIEKSTQSTGGKKKFYICVAAVHLIMECQENKKLLNGVNQAALVTPDGMPLVWISRLRGNKKVERVYGPELMLKLCKIAKGKQQKVFLLGGAKGQSQQVKKWLLKKFPKLLVVGNCDTPNKDIPKKFNNIIIKKINIVKPDIIFVGMGCPYQELWMIDNINKLSHGILIGVGAAFNFIVGREKQAPSWMQRNGLEWLFRLIQDPKRLWYRYLVLNMKFVIKLFSK